MISFTICIASHGKKYWKDMAERRALPSALAQDVPVLIRHEQSATRAEVRNALAEEATSDYVVFLDADDELAPGYISSMQEALARTSATPLLVPRVSYVRRGVREAPRFLDEPPLDAGNWIVVGAGVSRDLFWKVGGWRVFMETGKLNEYDDWDLWIRCQLAGSQPLRVKGSVYVAYVTNSSEHLSSTHRQRVAWMEEIQRANWPERFTGRNAQMALRAPRARRQARGRGSQR